MVASGNPHNGFLNVTMTYGLIGLGIFLWVIFTAIKTGWKLYNNIEDGFLKQLALWITIYLSALIVMFFISSEMEKSVFAYFQMGVISSIYSIYTEKDSMSSEVNCE